MAQGPCHLTPLISTIPRAELPERNHTIPANVSEPSLPLIRRSERSNKGEFRSTKYMDGAYLSASISFVCSQMTHLAYLAEVSTCCDAYAAKTYGSDPDSTSIHQAMNGEFAEEYIKAMQLEVATLIRQQTWTTVPRTEGLNVLKGTCVFKLKRLPDGTLSTFKARFCA
jgi:hypothetical protein